MTNIWRKGVTGLLVALLGITMSACGTSSAQSESDTKVGSNLEEITKLAKQEGKLELIGYPETWAGYGDSFKAFTKKYGIKIHVSSPDASSAEEIQSIQTLKGQPSQPDVPDLGYSFTDPAKQKNLLSSYTPSVANELPANLKDPDGKWVGAYYGVLSIGVDESKVPAVTSWKDLLKPVYKGKIYIGNPREGASQLAAVASAALANGGSLDNIQPGIDFFSKLAKDGYLAKASGTAQALTTGQAAVVLDWNYNFNGIRDEVEKAGVKLTVNVPTDGVFGNYYAQSALVDAPHPNAARLWLEWLLSDDGANIYAEHGAIPARFQEMKKVGTLTKEAEAGLPDADTLKRISFPNIEQGNKMSQLVVKHWGSQVANFE